MIEENLEKPKRKSEAVKIIGLMVLTAAFFWAVGYKIIRDAKNIEMEKFTQQIENSIVEKNQSPDAAFALRQMVAGAKKQSMINSMMVVGAVARIADKKIQQPELDFLNEESLKLKSRKYTFDETTDMITRMGKVFKLNKKDQAGTAAEPETPGKER